MQTTSGKTTKPIKTQTEIRPLSWPWVHLFQPTHFIVRELALPLEHLPMELDGMRIAVLSDLHLTPVWHKAYERVLETVEALATDMVLVTGDIVDDRRTHVPAMPVIRRYLPALRSRLGTFAILGNHDNIGSSQELDRLGIQMLDGRRILLETGKGSVELIGAMGPMWADMPEGFAARFEAPTRGVPRIVLAHFPDFFPKLQSLQPDIYLCGHTHAGQICLPTGAMLVRHDHSPRKLCRGYHRIGPTHYIVNQGLGFSGVAIRLFCPPEIVLIILKRAY